ncbi:membrane protein [Corynebacterium falsenii DSM 44353]|uniref:hypothetical protein n=1 Tax=Corynebacterium falsenii TaxID=108486 RepID=UPI0003E9286E|nr:hypothetical protein [Corynebacterium falsenii]AHI04002.1 membrane protein [Corynebacterium falsenii DSM 44353]UBI04784.1 hypothetical protein LA343_00945 [Corynebacterium falsenii]
MAISEDLYMEKSYKEGYVPSSLDSPHSSLHRTSTWVGMGLWLLAIFGLGIVIFGLETWMDDTQEYGFEIMIGGIIGVVVVVATAIGLIHAGRSNYRAYVKRSGRIQ